MADRYRVLRLLEYYGTADWLSKTFARNSVQGTRICGNGCEIREGMIGQLPIPLAGTRGDSSIQAPMYAENGIPTILDDMLRSLSPAEKDLVWAWLDGDSEAIHEMIEVVGREDGIPHVDANPPIPRCRCGHTALHHSDEGVCRNSLCPCASYERETGPLKSNAKGELAEMTPEERAIFDGHVSKRRADQADLDSRQAAEYRANNTRHEMGC